MMFSISGLAVLQYSQVSYQMLASCFPEVLGPFVEFSQRLKIEGDESFLFNHFQMFPVIFKLFNSISLIPSCLQASL